ncbi:MAG: hypothetical protein ACREE3_07520, partial [Stellaceae bacterium]
MIVTEVTGGDAVRQYLDGFANRLNARLLGVMAILGTQLQDRVRDKLGGAVLQRRSGRLAAGISFEVEATDGTTTVILGAGDVPYAGYQEYGFHGTETVRAHLRTIRHAFGRSIRPRAIEVHTY